MLNPLLTVNFRKIHIFLAIGFQLNMDLLDFYAGGKSTYVVYLPEFDSLIFMSRDCFHIRWHNKYNVNEFLLIFYVSI
jgi:hypothetical protein